MTDLTFVDAGTRQVLEAMPDAVLLVDHHGTIRFANTVTNKIFGYARNDLVGSSIEVLIPERFRQRHVDQRQAYAGHPHRREMGSGLGLVGRRRDGVEFPVDISLSPFETASGALVCAILRDMTQHRQQEEALRASEERFALAVRGSSDGIWDWNVLTGQVYYSPRFKELLDCLDAEFPDVFASFEAHLHPDDHAPTMASVREHLERRVPYDVEYRLQTGSGEYRWFRARGQALWDAAGQAIRMAGSITDITDRKRLQQRFELAVQASPVALLMIDARGRIVLANRWAEALFDFACDTLVGQSVSCLIPEEVREGHTALCAGFLAEPQMRAMGANRDLYGRRRDGSQVPIEVGLSPVETDDGLMVLCGIVDITERKQAIAAIEEAREAAESANRAKSDFLANMSHEIRTPLNAIIGMTELILQSELKPLQREYLTTVLESGESLLSIINEVLDFARIEAGRLDLLEVEFDLLDTLGDILKSLAFRAHCKNLELAWQAAADVPQFLLGDPVRLRQIIVNLVGNAIKFTEQGEVVVALDCTPHVADNTVLHIAVSDTGIGIPTDKLALIFEAFEQADSSTTRQFGGTGLGLAIASTLVKLMRGRIWVESVVKQGSTFHFTLPLQVVSQPAAPRPAADASSLGSVPVLVVDDNATNRKILERTLTAWGIDVTCVGGGAEALQLLRQRRQAGCPVRLVLTDINMPTMDGFMLAEEIHQDPALADTRIIALTSGIRADDVERCEQSRIAAHLMKPVKQAELQNTLLSVLSAGGATPRVDPTAGPAEAPADKRRPLRVLLVEDGLTNRKLAVGLLERRGHVVSVAEDGRLALASLEHEIFDVILMDVQMPVMDGLEATREIRRRERLTGGRTPIIAMTAHALKGDRERCLEAGMDGYLAKPVRAQDLYETIEAVLAQVVAGTPATTS